MNKIFSIGLVTVLIIISTVSCKKNTDNKTVIYQVEPSLTLIGPRPPASVDEPVNIPAMVLIEAGTIDTIYLTLNRIEGFEYAEGYRYKIKVQITHLKNPPADGYIFSYSLLELLSKEKIEK